MQKVCPGDFAGRVGVVWRVEEGAENFVGVLVEGEGVWGLGGGVGDCAGLWLWLCLCGGWMWGWGAAGFLLGRFGG